MSKHQPLNFDPTSVETPAFVVDLGLLRQNLELLASVQERAGCKVLLALKGFSMFSTFDLVRQYLSGCCASGLHEALLAREEFNKEVHVYAPAFKEAEMRQIIPIADHISFNSFRQWQEWRPMLDAARAAGHAPSPGIRVNPEHSEVEVALYDPCSPGCRLGARADSLTNENLDGLEGLHFHALCEQDSDVLERTLAAVEQRFPWLLERVKWVNMGGGHHITRHGYDVERLIRVITDFRTRWGKDVYLEPGEAVALNTGFLIASVLDVVGEGKLHSTGGDTKLSKSDAAISADLFPHRSQADSRTAVEALCEVLEALDRGAEGTDAAQRIHAEAQSLLQWANENGWLLAPEELADLTGPVEQIGGGSEHDVFLSLQSNRVFKLTRPPNFGARGTALLYLRNVAAVNHLLSDDWRLEAVVNEGGDGVRLLTSQPYVPGRRADVEEIDAGVPPDGIASTDAETTLPTAILDTSATCHMPDTLEMPYRPHVIGSGVPGEHAYTYKLGGMSCLAGDVINEYSFPQPLQIGQKLVFTDMAHYTMVKTTTFNGVPHPDIDVYDPATGEVRVVRRFGYADFKQRLS